MICVLELRFKFFIVSVLSFYYNFCFFLFIKNFKGGDFWFFVSRIDSVCVFLICLLVVVFIYDYFCMLFIFILFVYKICGFGFFFWSSESLICWNI